MKARDELPRLQALNLPSATPEIFNARVREDAPDKAEAEKELNMLAEYLKQFVPPSDCICCGERLGAKNAVDAFLGGATFVWELAHGEGKCSKCGYPGRAIHSIGDPEFLCIRNYILQYHPNQLTTQNEHP